jgi:hypothetical protein
LGPVVRTTVTPLHRALTSDDGGQVVLRLADVGALLVAAITALAPGSEAVIPDDLDVTLAQVGGQEMSADLVGVAHTVDLLAWLLPLLGLMLLAGAGLLRGRDWRLVARSVGAGVMAAAGLLAVLLVVASVLASRADEQTVTGALGAAVWAELDGSFWLTAAVTASIGLLLRIAASPGLDLDPSTLMRRGWAALVTPGLGARVEILRAVTVVGVGGLLLLRPLTVVALVASVAGFVLLLGGVRSLGRAMALWWTGRTKRPPRAVALRPTGAVLAAMALVAVLVVQAVPGQTRLPMPVASTDGTCNGHAQLCDRRYDEVAFAGTHNSMSAADQPGWFLAEQPHGIMRQLDDGIRVLLVDSWNGQRTQRSGVIANTADSRQAGFDEAESTYGPELVQSALRLRDSLDLTPTGEVRPYLCHALCELGSTDWEPLMVEVRHWLDQHPREVVTFLVQDEVSPADTAALVEKAGLMPYVHVPRTDGTWPTLGEMISSGRRLVFLLEHDGGGATNPWLIDSRKVLQDTPYSFTRTSQFSCKRFRGPKDASLFLVNHWLSNYTRRVTDARSVNAEGVLLPRLERCRAERGQIPNFVAVDNYDQGDLVSVVDRLNGVTGK